MSDDSSKMEMDDKEAKEMSAFGNEEEAKPSDQPGHESIEGGTQGSGADADDTTGTTGEGGASQGGGSGGGDGDGGASQGGGSTGDAGGASSTGGSGN